MMVNLIWFRFRWAIYRRNMETKDLVIQWAEDRNLIKGSSPQAQMMKLVEELGELANGIARGNRTLIEDSIGDVRVVLTILAKQLDFDDDICFQHAYNEIKDRKGKMGDGVFVKEV